MKIVRYISICLLFTFIGSLLPTKAQDNPYKIDHSLYLLYEEATKHRNNATGLEIADTIYTKAIRINDKKAQCLALTIPVIYYFNNGKTELLEKAISRLQEISRKNNYLQYYYFGSIYKVNYLMNTGNTLRANGLEPLEEICKVSSRLIVNKASFKRKQTLLNPILAQLEKAVEERESKK